MSEEYEHETIETVETTDEVHYSPFVPLLILVIGILIWVGYQDYAQNSQRALYNQQFTAAVPTINAAQGVGTKYVALMKDLLQTSAKNQYAAQIVKDAIQAGWIRVNPNGTNTTTTPAAPTPSTDSTPAPASNK